MKKRCKLGMIFLGQLKTTLFSIKETLKVMMSLFWGNQIGNECERKSIQ